jgi:hypothetical protein
VTSDSPKQARRWVLIYERGVWRVHALDGHQVEGAEGESVPVAPVEDDRVHDLLCELAQANDDSALLEAALDEMADEETFGTMGSREWASLMHEKARDVLAVHRDGPVKSCPTCGGEQDKPKPISDMPLPVDSDAWRPCTDSFHDARVDEARAAVIAAAQEMDRVCRELAWWTLPVAPPDELMEEARSVIRAFREAHAEYDGTEPLPPHERWSSDVADWLERD